jgi:hypothetical protein
VVRQGQGESRAGIQESGSQPERAMVRVVAKLAVGDESNEIAYWMTVPVADRDQPFREVRAS